MNYQSHDGADSTSDSGRKLARIQLPEQLFGKKVLDIGCNEGFFCAEAARRGADVVVGLDVSESAIALAKQLYGDLGIQFETGHWGQLPEGPFDFVLWLSAMHYEHDPAIVLRRIFDILNPGGVLILECGVHDSYSTEMVPRVRPRDIAWYPTPGLIYDLLSEFAVRQTASPELTPGDSVPRWVFRCEKRQPTVVLLRGSSTSGKSSLARKLAPVATKVLTLDGWLYLLSQDSEMVNPLLRYINANFHGDNLEPLYLGIDENGLTSDYVDLLAKGIVASDDLVVVDGYMTDAQTLALTERISRRCVVWEINRK